MEPANSESFSAIAIESHGGSTVIRFNRPEIRNPLSISTLDQLEAAFTAAESDAQIHAVIFTGTDGIFASGADLREVAQLSPETAPAFSRRAQSLFDRFATTRLTTIAAVNGTCMGGAFDLILACKRRVAAPTATFGHPGARLGIITGWGGTQRLPRLVGRARALDLFLTTRMVGANEALAMGLIDEIADPVMDRALEPTTPVSG
jgi:enoyl-CoA hydratase